MDEFNIDYIDDNFDPYEDEDDFDAFHGQQKII
jgi:hypothetical protein